MGQSIRGVEGFPGSEAPLNLLSKSVNRSQPRCPRNNGAIWLNAQTGEWSYWRCGRNRCGYCGPINAKRTAQAISLAKPERFFTLTQVGEDWQTVRARMNRLGYDLRKRLGSDGWSWAWHVEPNPKGTGHHVHGLQHGRFIAQRELSGMADRRGMGYVVDIRRVEDGDAAAHYGLKLAEAAYSMKLVEEPESLHLYLDVNGDRLVHASRSFWRDGEHGRLRGVRAARSAAAGGAKTWDLVQTKEGWRGATSTASQPSDQGK